MYFEKLLFLTYKGALAILDRPCAVAKQHQNTIFEIEMQCTHNKSMIFHYLAFFFMKKKFAPPYETPSYHMTYMVGYKAIQ